LLGTLCVIDREPHTLTEAQVEALEIVGRLAIADIELRRDLQELKDALAGPDAAEESAPGLDEIISRLHEVASNLQAVREGST
jgi:GAF domain-containing protein